MLPKQNIRKLKLMLDSSMLLMVTNMYSVAMVTMLVSCST